MTDPKPQMSAILVILDPDYGPRLREVPPGRPIWIAMSPANEPVVRSLWQTRTDVGSVTGITGFRFDAGVAAEENFLANLDTIDLHHGPYSTPVPYTELEVIGAPLNSTVRAVLSQIGFTQFITGEDGFVARRSKEEAMRA
ncbi:MAG TPA: hypothetical protein VGM25_14550 [Caulobacteraceae bacterium]